MKEAIMGPACTWMVLKIDYAPLLEAQLSLATARHGRSTVEWHREAMTAVGGLVLPFSCGCNQQVDAALNSSALDSSLSTHLP